MIDALGVGLETISLGTLFGLCPSLYNVASEKQVLIRERMAAVGISNMKPIQENW